MTLNLITAPTSEPLNVEETKLWLRLDGDQELDVVARLITAAVAMLDGASGYLGRCLAEQTWEMTIDSFPVAREINIPLPPVQSIVSVKYTDASGVAQTLSPDNYRFTADEWSSTITLEDGSSWPSVGYGNSKVTVRFTSGYPGGVPQGLKLDILNLVGIWFDDRTSAGQLPSTWSSRYRAASV